MRRYSMFSLAAISLCALGFFAVPSFADDPATTTPPAAATTAKPNAGARARGQRNVLRRVLQSLNLSNDQKDKIKAILQDQQNQAKALRKDTTLTQEEKRAKRQDLNKDTLGKIKDVLTPDQQKTLQQEIAKLRHARRRRGQQGAATNSTTTTPDTTPAK